MLIHNVRYQYMFFFYNSVKKLAVASLNHAEQVGAIQFLYYTRKIKNVMLSILYPASVY